MTEAKASEAIAMLRRHFFAELERLAHLIEEHDAHSLRRQRDQWRARCEQARHDRDSYRQRLAKRDARITKLEAQLAEAKERARIERGLRLRLAPVA